MLAPKTVVNESVVIRAPTTKKRKFVRAFFVVLLASVVGRVVGIWAYRIDNGYVKPDRTPQTALAATAKIIRSLPAQTALSWSQITTRFPQKSAHAPVIKLGDAWKRVSSSLKYRALNAAGEARIRDDFFNDFVAPQIRKDQFVQAHAQFERDTASLAQLRRQAASGDRSAQYMLGVMYLKGDQVRKDPKKAAELVHEAAEGGYAKAQLHLAGLYAVGLGVPKNADKSVRWLRKAAAHGDTTAEVYLASDYQGGDGVPISDVKAFKWFQRAALQGSVFAEDWVGTYLYYGFKGIPQRPVEAVAWWQKAAARGYGTAEDELGHAYFDGRGVPKNDTRAFEWFQKAAAQGVPDAESLLSTMYDSGIGVQKDEVLAYAWINLAATQRGCALPNGGAASAGTCKWFARWTKESGKIRDLIGQNLNSYELAEAQRLSANWKPGHILHR